MIESIIEWILILSSITAVVLYFISSFKSNIIEASIIGVMQWGLYIIWSMILLPLKTIILIYLMIMSLLLKLVIIPLKSLVKYTRRSSKSIHLLDEVDAYYYYTVEEALGFYSWLRRLTPWWLKKVGPTVSREPEQEYLFFWGYLLRYSLIVVYYTFLKLRNKSFIFIRYLLGIELFYTIWAFTYILLRSMTKENTILWKIVYFSRRQFFILMTHWHLFHFWTALKLKLAGWKYKDNLEDWDQPRWLFQLPLTEEQLSIFDKPSEKKEMAKRYSLLQWFIIVIMGLLYNTIGILAVMVLPTTIYIYLFRNQEKNNYIGLILGKYVYIPYGLYLISLWGVKLMTEILPAILLYSSMKIVKTIWNIRVLLLVSIIFFLTYNDIDYSKIIGFYTLRLLWFDWMFWVPFQYDSVIYSHGALLDVWHPGYFWNPRMIKPLLLNRSTVFIDEWVESLIVLANYYDIEIETLEHVKESWALVKEEGLQTYLYFARTYMFLDIELIYKRFVIFTIKSILNSYHWWWLTYMQFNEFYTYCFILIIIKKILYIPFKLAIYYNLRIQERLPLIGLLPSLIFKGIGMAISITLKVIKYSCNITIFYLRELLKIRIDVSWIWVIIKPLIKFYYTISIFKIVARHFCIEDIIAESWPTWAWYIHLVIREPIELITQFQIIVKQPFFFNGIVMDYLQYMFSITNYESIISKEFLIQSLALAIHVLHKLEKLIDTIYINIELPLNIADMYIESSGEQSELDTIFLEEDINGVRNMFNWDWLEDSLVYFDSLDSWTYIEEYYAKRDANWNEKKFKPEYLVWQLSKISDPARNIEWSDYWWWFQKRHWWWTFYREYWYSEDHYIEPQLTEGQLMNLLSLSVPHIYYMSLISLILLNRGFWELIKGDIKTTEYVTNIEMAWRFFRNQKPGEVLALYINENDIASLKKVTKLNLEKKLKRKLYPELLNKTLNNKITGKVAAKLIKDLKSRNLEEGIISKQYFNFYLKEKYSSFRKNTVVDGEKFTPFIAFLFSRNSWMKKTWQEMDEDDYESLNENYREDIETYRSWWANNVLWLEEVNQKWFEGKLESWVLPKEFQSFEVLKSRDVVKSDSTDYETEETEVTYFEYGLIYWFIYLPIIFLYQCYSVESDVASIFMPLANYYGYEMMYYYYNIISHFASWHEILWWSPDNFPAYKLSGTTDSDEDTTVADFYKWDINTEAELYFFEGDYYQNSRYSILMRDSVYTSRDWIGATEEIRLVEYLLRIVTVICLLFISRIKKVEKPLEQTKIAISVWYKIKKTFKTQWYWK